MPSYQGPLRKMGKSACAEFTAAADALVVLENITVALEKVIADEARDIMLKADRKVLNHTDIEFGTSLALDLDYYSKKACRSCAVLGFPAAAMKRNLHQRHRIEKVGITGLAKLNGILTDIMMDLMDRACRRAQLNKRVRVLPRDIAEAIDEEKNSKLRAFLQQGTIKRSGVLA